MSINTSFNSALSQLDRNLEQVKTTAEAITRDVEIDTVEDKLAAAEEAKSRRADTTGALHEVV